jgi:hypothetical protein
MIRPLLFGCALVLGLALPAQDELRLGAGEHTYRWISGWAKLPDGMSLGNTHGCIVVDSRDRVYVNTDTENAVVVFSAGGDFVKAWGVDFAGGLHGMVLFEEQGEERLWLAHTGRHEVVKTTLDGDVLQVVGYPQTAGIYGKADEYRPTGVAVGPDGSLFVADGYGRSWVHRYDAQGVYLGSFGGPGSEPGRMRTPHGIRLETGGERPLLLVADRENHRLQSFDLAGELVAVHEGHLRRPCNTTRFGELLAVADLAGRVTLLGADYGLLAQLGDNPDESLRAVNGVPAEKWKPGEFLSPHGIAFDSKGDLYVMDWNFLGRVTKLRRVK